MPARSRKGLSFRPRPLLHTGFFFLVFAFLCPSLTPAQEVTLPAVLITSDSGMASEWVSAIFQDRIGFMWFGTNLGVARHDGIQFRVFRRANTLPDPLSDDYVQAIAQDEGGDLWLGTRKGLNRFRYASETFSVMLHDPRDPGSLNGDVIAHLARWSSRPGCLWVATLDGGLGLLDLKTGKCKGFRPDASRPGSLASLAVRRVFEDSRNRVWVATANGLQRFIPETGSFEVFRHDPGCAATISDASAGGRSAAGAPGILWVGTGGNFAHGSTASAAWSSGHLRARGDGADAGIGQLMRFGEPKFCPDLTIFRPRSHSWRRRKWRRLSHRARRTPAAAQRLHRDLRPLRLGWPRAGTC